MIAGDAVRRALDARDPGLALLVERAAEGEWLDYHESRPDADHTTFIDAFLQGAFFFDQSPEDDSGDDSVPGPTPELERSL